MTDTIILNSSQASLNVVALYVGLNLLIILVLGANVIRQRLSTKTNLGDGGNEKMTCAMRAHANACEWVPGFLIGLVLAAFIGAPVIAIHVLGAVFTIARVFHGIGLNSNPGRTQGRFYGSLVTFISYLVLGLGLVVHTFI